MSLDLTLSEDRTCLCVGAERELDELFSGAWVEFGAVALCRGVPVVEEDCREEVVSFERVVGVAEEREEAGELGMVSDDREPAVLTPEEVF